MNAIHSRQGGPIRNDLLTPGAETQQLLIEAGFTNVQVEDTEERYVAVGQLLCPL